MNDILALSVEQRAELALCLVNEAEEYQYQRNGFSSLALVRYAQSLSVFQSLNMPNLPWISYILFNLGKIHRLEGRPYQSAAHLRAAAYIQRSLPATDEGEEMLQEIRQLLIKTGPIGLAAEMTPEHSYLFLVRVRLNTCHRFEVTPAGEIHWDSSKTLEKPEALGPTGWDVICVNAGD